MKSNRSHVAVVSTLLLGMAVASTSSAQDNARYTIPNSKPGFVATAKDLGSAPSTQQITVYLWLQMHNADSLRDLVEQQYDPSSVNYHNWLTEDEFNSTYAPTGEEVETVKGFLAAHNLGVLSVGERNLYVKAQGSIAEVQTAFSVQIHQFNVNGKIYRANTTDPVMEGSAGALVSRVGGMSDYRLQPHILRPVNPATGKPFREVPLSRMAGSPYSSSTCLQPPELVNFTTDGGQPVAIYTGNKYGTPVDNTGYGGLLTCGYGPGALETGYGLTALYNAGLNGGGQGVVIVDAWGSPTIAYDAQEFSSIFGLPGLSLTVYSLGETCAAYPGTTTGLCQGWASETSLDVESAHTVAPGAHIILVEAASDSEDDLVAGILFAVHHNLGNVISNSYGGPESQQGLPSYDPFDPVLLLAAAHGIAVNFSSGDDGDYYAVEGYTDVTYPASSPFATGVGGTSLFLNSNQTMNFQTGWGSNGTVIAAPPVSPYSSVPIVPPDVVGFIYGSGGGTSAVFSKPSWQRSLPGSHRMVPDISFTADPYTGLEVICTGASCFNSDPVDLYLGVIGGTSLACPMFSALWAVANEQSGRPLGQAAPLLYSLPSGAITDVVPVGSAADVTGVITNDHVITHYSALQLIQPETSAAFVSAIWDANSVGAPGPWIILSFGTDSSLFTTHGWDDVTGLGTPNGLNFVNAVAPPRH